MRVTAIFMSALLGAGLIVGGTAWGATDPSGVWIDDQGRGGVEIKECQQQTLRNIAVREGFEAGHSIQDISDETGCPFLRYFSGKRTCT